MKDSYLILPDKESLNQFEKIQTKIINDHKETAKLVALEIAIQIKLKQSEKKNFILGLATGSTPTLIYKELIRMHNEEMKKDEVTGLHDDKGLDPGLFYHGTKAVLKPGAYR